jgi:hypothetical protein
MYPKYTTMPMHASSTTIARTAGEGAGNAAWRVGVVSDERLQHTCRQWTAPSPVSARTEDDLVGDGARLDAAQEAAGRLGQRVGGLCLQEGFGEGECECCTGVGGESLGVWGACELKAENPLRLKPPRPVHQRMAAAAAPHRAAAAHARWCCSETS